MKETVHNYLDVPIYLKKKRKQVIKFKLFILIKVFYSHINQLNEMHLKKLKIAWHIFIYHLSIFTPHLVFHTIIIIILHLSQIITLAFTHIYIII